MYLNEDKEEACLANIRLQRISEGTGVEKGTFEGFSSVGWGIEVRNNETECFNLVRRRTF